ncbi:hypothetical protein [Cellulomonas sp. PSBB021]|uniref:hypothetical protein n=1 Tax=Cellulomonas sp. PSBB021 TaxID=2003551 RepID=UPI000B8DB11A|nr:hypothetical protein [Cellulomonas sp. PSBB021]ASR55828.1 hypothetical protein CBP52_12780 [Cellulomonas sp. PSBB021]
MVFGLVGLGSAGIAMCADGRDEECSAPRNCCAGDDPAGADAARRLVDAAGAAVALQAEAGSPLAPIRAA